MSMREIHLPCGTVYINESPIEQSFYIQGTLHTLKPKGVKYLGAGGPSELVQYLMYPAFWEHRKELESVIAGTGKVAVLLDVSKTDRIGDMVIMTTIPKAYKMAYGDQATVDVLVTKGEPAAVWENNPNVRQLYYDAAPTDQKYDVTIDANKIELKFQSDKNCTDLILERLGLNLINKTPMWRVTDEERKWAQGFIASRPTEKGPLVAFHVISVAMVRSYPQAAALAGRLKEDLGWNVLDLPKGIGIRKIAALIEQCESVVTVDTAILHIAGAMKKRVYAIFGHTDGVKAAENYEKAVIIKGKCSLEPSAMPCWWEVKCLAGGSTYKEKEQLDYTPCMSALTPEEIIIQIKAAQAKIKKVLIGMLTFNLLHWTKVAVESVRSWHDYDLLVVDNASTDGTQQWLKDNGVEYIEGRMPVSAAQNVLNKRLRERDYEYLLLLNNDVALRYDTTDKLIAFQQQHPEFWITTAAETNGVPPWAIDKAQPSGEDFVNIIDIPSSSFSCTLITRECILKVGDYDTRFVPRYIDDNDYALRTRLLGGKFAKYAGAIYFHVLGALVKSDEAERKLTFDHAWGANKALYVEKWGIDPHEYQALQKLGLEWTHAVTYEKIKAANFPHVQVVRRMGGYGDIIFSTIIAKILKREMGSHVAVSYAVPEKFRSLLQAYPYIEQTETLPRPDFYIDITDLEFRVENQECHNHGRVLTPRTEIYLNVLGLPVDDITPEYFTTSAEDSWAQSVWLNMVRSSSNPHSGTKNILVSLRGSNKMKEWIHTDDLVKNYMPTLGAVIALENETRYTFRQMAALAKAADVVVSPDTGTSNVAAALGVPTVTLFGYRNGDVFEKMFPSMIIIQGQCSLHNKQGGCDFTVNCLGGGAHRLKENIRVTDCMSSITPKRVYEIVKEIVQ